MFAFYLQILAFCLFTFYKKETNPMCCPFNSIQANLYVYSAKIEKDENKQETLQIDLIYDKSPKTWADRISQFFQRIELCEKIAEIADECYHLFNSTFQTYTNAKIYQTLGNLHFAAHNLEHVLHSFCLLGDLSYFLSGNFWEYQDPKKTQIDYLYTVARVCHSVSHFFSFSRFLLELDICRFVHLKTSIKWSGIFSSLGYFIALVSLIWKRHQNIVNKEFKSDNKGFKSDMAIHLGGFFFESYHFANKLEIPLASNKHLSKFASVSGIVHAWFVTQKLMPKDKEEIEGNFVIQPKSHSHQNKKKIMHPAVNESSHSHHCHH